jgi:hypothetical protein
MKTTAILIIAIFLTGKLATAQDTMYVYKAGVIAYQQAVSSIDSITFYGTVQVPVQKNMVNILKDLGLISVSGATKSLSMQKGDVIQLGYHDNFYKADYKLKINEELSTKDQMVFDGTTTSTSSGQISLVRRTVTPLDSGIVVKEQVSSDEGPISENTQWDDNGTMKYVPVAGGVAEYQVMKDGSEEYNFKIVPKTPTSVSKLYSDGQLAGDLTNIFVVQK